MNYKTKLQKDYEELIPTIKWLSIAAQFISGATASFGIYVVILQKIPIPIKVLAILVTLLLTIIIIGSFEGGIRKIYPFWIRQLLRWLFERGEEGKKQKSLRIVLFSMLCILLIPLVLGTTIASWKASPDLVAFGTPPPQLVNMEAVNSNMDNSNAQVFAGLENGILRDSINFQRRIEAEKDKWNAKIEAQAIQHRKYKKLYENGQQWAGGSAAKIKNQIIPKLKSKRETAIQQLYSGYSERLDSLQKAKAQILILHQQNKSQILNSTKASNDLEQQKQNSSIEKWSGFLALLAILATLFTLFCFTFIEAFKIGSADTNDKSQLTFFPNINGQEIGKTPSVNGHNHNNNDVPQNTPKNGVPVPSKHVHQIDFVSLDKLIKRTRQQWKRGNDEMKSTESRATNKRKAEENIEFLRSIGVGVRVLDENRLEIERKEIA